MADVAEKINLIANSGGHAFVISGDAKKNKQHLELFLRDTWGIHTDSNADYSVLNKDVLDIDSVRGISTAQSLGMSQSKTKRVFVVIFNSATIEAQNAFLKTLEEPSEGTTIFLLVPHSLKLLPTIKSRVQEIKGEGSHGHVDLVREFLSKDFQEREKIYTEYFLADKKKDKPADKINASLFFLEIERQLFDNKSNINDFEKIYENIISTTQYVNDRSSNIKYIFEYVSLIIPVLQ